jgi:hypothetical protein
MIPCLLLGNGRAKGSIRFGERWQDSYHQTIALFIPVYGRMAAPRLP